VLLLLRGSPWHRHAFCSCCSYHSCCCCRAPGADSTLPKATVKAGAALRGLLLTINWCASACAAAAAAEGQSLQPSCLPQAASVLPGTRHRGAGSAAQQVAAAAAFGCSAPPRQPSSCTYCPAAVMTPAARAHVVLLQLLLLGCFCFCFCRSGCGVRRPLPAFCSLLGPTISALAADSVSAEPARHLPVVLLLLRGCPCWPAPAACSPLQPRPSWAVRSLDLAANVGAELLQLLLPHFLFCCCCCCCP
jgi:hypothetical protein